MIADRNGRRSSPKGTLCQQVRFWDGHRKGHSSDSQGEVANLDRRWTQPSSCQRGHLIWPQALLARALYGSRQKFEWGQWLAWRSCSLVLLLQHCFPGASWPARRARRNLCDFKSRVWKQWSRAGSCFLRVLVWMWIFHLTWCFNLNLNLALNLWDADVFNFARNSP